jgi:hypothetical protein
MAFENKKAMSISVCPWLCIACYSVYSGTSGHRANRAEAAKKSKKSMLPCNLSLCHALYLFFKCYIGSCVLCLQNMKLDTLYFVKQKKIDIIGNKSMVLLKPPALFF